MKRIRNLKEQIKNKYRQIRSVSSRAFPDEMILFDKHGLKHIFQKQRKLRDPRDQYRRFSLLDKAVISLQVSKEYLGKKVVLGESQKISFWIFENVIDGIRVRTIVRQLGNGNKHFYSVMSIGKTKIPK